jgi:hypothetical protein
MKRSYIFALATALLGTPVLAGGGKPPGATPKRPAKSAPAVGFDGVMKKLAMPVSKDADGDFLLTLRWTEEKRRQVVYINGKPTVVRNQKLRKIWSPCWKGKGLPDVATLEKLLSTATTEAGGFRLDPGPDGGYVGFFAIDIPEDSRPAYIEAMVHLVAELADDMEKALLGSDEM